MYFGGTVARERLQDLDDRHPNFWEDPLMWAAFLMTPAGCSSDYTHNRRPSIFPSSANEYRFGFSSIKQILDWVDDVDILLDMQHEGMLLAHYKVGASSAIHGSKQVMMLETDMHLIHTEELMAVLK